MGMCSFGQGQSCEEWNLFRGNCNPGGRFFDAFTFCLAQGDGPVLDSAPPMGLAKLLTEQGILPADAAAEMLPNTRWRCMGGEVWVCPIGANLPCDEQADLSREPTAAMKEFCTTNFGANSIPSYVTGRATVYDWSCDGETAQPGAQRLTTDPMGFLAEFWYRVETPGML